MQKLPKNYQQLTAELKQVAAKYKFGIDLAMLETEGQVYIFKPLEEFTPSEPPRLTTQKDEGDFQDCFNKMSEEAEKFGFSLDLIRLNSNTGAKMIIGLFEAYKKYGADNAHKH